MNGRKIPMKAARSEGLGPLPAAGRRDRGQAPTATLRTWTRAGGDFGDAPPGHSASQRPAGFTLMELMVVLAIIGIVATLGMPMIKAHSQTNAIAAADRQLLDDISLARLKAINNRTTVYMVFAPPNLTNQLGPLKKPPFLSDLRPLKVLTNLFSGQYSAYALVAERTAGDQPGRPTRKYLTEWRSLPEGIFIAPGKFTFMQPARWRFINPTNRPFAYTGFYPDVNGGPLLLPFPTVNSPVFNLPCVAFNPLGQLKPPPGMAPLNMVPPAFDEVIPLTRGSMMFTKDRDGNNSFVPPDFREIPPGNSTNAYNRLHVYWQTGRAKVEKLEVR